MTNVQIPPGAAPAVPATSTLVLQGVYLKDCSFEAPQGPRGNGEWNPQISLDLNTAVTPLAGRSLSIFQSMFSARAACIIFAMFAGGLATGMFGGATHAHVGVGRSDDDGVSRVAVA